MQCGRLEVQAWGDLQRRLQVLYCGVREASVIYREQHPGGETIVVEPNRSSDWQTNKWVLVALCCLSAVIAGFFVTLGAWPILPLAGLEMLALGGALYYVSWKLQYRHVITLDGETVQVQKGHYRPRQSWRFRLNEARLSVRPEQHPWDGPRISLCHGGDEVSLGEFLNREDSEDLLALLRHRIRVSSYGPRVRHPF